MSVSSMQTLDRRDDTQDSWGTLMSDTPKQDVVIVTPVYGPTLEELDRRFTLHRLWDAKDRAAFYAPLADRVRAIVSSGHAGADAAMMDALPKTELIACFGVGYDAIDVAAA